MKKKILAVALGLTLCFGMTGCQSVTKDLGGSTTIELEKIKLSIPLALADG